MYNNNQNVATGHDNGTASIPQTTEELANTLEVKKRRHKLWCCVRIVDYRLQAVSLVALDGETDEPEWADLGTDTFVSADRESVFSLCRRMQGLLLSVDGLPASGRLARFRAMCDSLPGAAA